MYEKKITFLSKLIILIFFSEIINSISKILQLLKYQFNDLRDDKNFSNPDTPRGIICQIQIVTSIFSDFCSLFTTLLLSLRCYDVIKNKKDFDKGKNGILSIIIIIILSIILSIGLLFLDRNNTGVSFRFDVRDRCSYWCWLGYISSMICFGLYSILLILNIIFVCINVNKLRREYKEILKESEISSQKSNMSIPLNDIPKDNNNSKNNNQLISNKKYINLTKEEKKRIEQLKLIRTKCLVYPIVTIIIWSLINMYKIFDIIFVGVFDEGDTH